MKNEITEKIIKKIKEEKIIPKPKWQFLIRNYLIWILGIISLIIGSLAMSVIIYMMDNNEWDLYKDISGSFLNFFFASLPYFWIVFLLIFILITYYNFKHTKKGYKFQLSTIILSSIFASLILGLFFYNVGLAKIIDKTFADIPVYKQFLDPRNRVWSQSERGFLTGVIVSVKDQENFVLIDIDRKLWQIENNYDQFDPIPQIRVKMIGEKIDEDIFKAFEIMPFFPEKGHMRPLMK